MAKVGRWIIENWQLFAMFGFLLFSLAMTGSITKGIRAAKEGFKEIWNPLGFFVFVTIIVVIYVLYKRITSM